MPVNPFRVLLHRLSSGRTRLFAYFIPTVLAENSDELRRARLIIGFGFLGTIFGAGYAIFYALIGHLWGAAIIVICSAGFTATLFMFRSTRDVALSGRTLSVILLVGFSALSAIEGGARGHAVAWLSAVPLCALLLSGRRSAVVICAFCFFATAAFFGLENFGVRVPALYPARWEHVIALAGFLGLPVFMTLLGWIFETSRRAAFDKMETALAELSQANARLRELNREKNEFLGMVSHDLKNPLGVIMGFAELAAHARETSAQNREYLSYIATSAQRMLEMITQLLDINALEQGRSLFVREPCELAEVSARVVEAQALLAAQKQIHLRVAPPPEPLWVSADAKALHQIMENFLSNAIKYSPRGAEVFVRMGPAADGGVRWEVEDRGAGIPAQEQSKLFQKFSRLSTRPTEGESSTGLGLSIVKQLCEMMDGAVECRSTVGAGSTFGFCLPAAPSPALI